MQTKISVLVAGVALAMLTGAAHAATIVYVAGDLQGHAYTAQLNLDVTNNVAASGSGSFTGFGLTNADLVLITTSTPYNETNPGPVGFRGNDGTDYGGLDQAYPISTNGLLFDVGTTTASFGGFPLFAVYSNGDGTYGAAFTGKVDGITYYNQVGSAMVSMSPVPLPASAAMFGAALLGLAGLGVAAKRRTAAASV